MPELGKLHGVCSTVGHKIRFADCWSFTASGDGEARIEMQPTRWPTARRLPGIINMRAGNIHILTIGIIIFHCL